MRSGLDMAHSENQNQVALWGRHVLGEARREPGAGGSGGGGGSGPEAAAAADENPGAWNGMVAPGPSLRYWCAVHRRVARLGAALGPARFLLLDFDALCQRPEEVS